MDIKSDRTQFSVFGQYLNIEASSACIGDLFLKLREFDFVPSTISVLQFQGSTQEVKVVYRPQFVNPNIGCTISILPDRIDFEYVSADLNDKPNLVERSIIFLNAISQVANISGNRVAYAEAINILDQATITKIASSMEMIQGGANPSTIEKRTHSLARRNVDLDEKQNEVFNINFDIEYKTIFVDNCATEKVQLYYDINTIAEENSFRINANNIANYFNALKLVRDQMLEELSKWIQVL